MRGAIAFLVVLLISTTVAPEPGGAEDVNTSMKTSPRVAEYISQRSGEFEQIPNDRKQALTKLALYVRSRVSSGEPAKLIFICTHNSRRSQLSQILAAAAANYYSVPKVECFSGGTEATAFNPRAVATLERAGIEIEKTSTEKNPKYQVHLADGLQLVCFSKKYFESPNPPRDFCAVMTCSSADKDCPIVAGASLRVAVPYEDPQASDGTPQEAATYDERCAQICREMLYLFSQVGR